MKRVAMDARQLREFLAALDPGWECEQQDGAKCPWPVKLVAGEYRARWEKVGPRTAKVGWFVGDAPEFTPHLTHDAFDAVFTQPTLIFQGLQDTVVDPRTVEQFANGRTNVTLSLLEDDHQLGRSLDRMWYGIEDFLGLVE